jgi:hypothetical protein
MMMIISKIRANKPMEETQEPRRNQEKLRKIEDEVEFSIQW